MECKASASMISEEAPFALIDGQWDNVEVAPGEWLGVTITDTDDILLVDRHKSSRCRLKLRLESGSWLESAEFTP